MHSASSLDSTIQDPTLVYKSLALNSGNDLAVMQPANFVIG